MTRGADLDARGIVPATLDPPGIRGARRRRPSLHWLLLLGVGLSSASACSSGPPAAPGAVDAAEASLQAGAGKKGPRPFGGRCDTTLEVRPPLAEDPANLLRLRIEYVCQLKHMGRTSAVAEQTVTFTGPSTAIASNKTTYIAANGDELWATWTGTAVSDGPVNTFSGPEVYTGGTGRFAGASGSSWITGTASLATGRGSFTSEGSLQY